MWLLLLKRTGQGTSTLLGCQLIKIGYFPPILYLPCDPHRAKNSLYRRCSAHHLHITLQRYTICTSFQKNTALVVSTISTRSGGTLWTRFLLSSRQVFCDISLNLLRSLCWYLPFADIEFESYDLNGQSANVTSIWYKNVRNCSEKGDFKVWHFSSIWYFVTHMRPSLTNCEAILSNPVAAN